jgi:hypothetical protein
MRSMRAAATLAVIASSASAQSSLAACGDPPDSTARQTIVSAGNLKVCLLAMRADPADSTPRQWATRSHVVVLETQQPGDFRRLALDRATAWTINGKPAPFDSTAESWQQVVIDVLDAGWGARRLGLMAEELRATDIPLPTNPDSVKARLASLDKQLTLLQSKIVWADGEVERARRGASVQSANRNRNRGNALTNALAEVKRLYQEMGLLNALKDILLYQI